jgi:hypothetical protein
LVVVAEVLEVLAQLHNQQKVVPEELDLRFRGSQHPSDKHLLLESPVQLAVFLQVVEVVDPIVALLLAAMAVTVAEVQVRQSLQMQILELQILVAVAVDQVLVVLTMVQRLAATADQVL